MKNIFVFFLIFTFSKFVFAAQCPSAEDWSHEPGKDWQLSARAQKEGWQPSTYPGAKTSDLTRLPADKYLLIGISMTVHRFTTCGYSLQRGDHDKVIAAFNTTDAVDVKDLPKPPFFCKTPRCFCETVAGDPGKCVWDWK